MDPKLHFFSPSLPVTGDPFGVTCHRLRLVLHCCVLLCGAMLCFAMLGYALLGYALLCFAMLCRALLGWGLPDHGAWLAGLGT